ncbi:uncharacterized protein LOC111050675 isoform X2 [Nilaparvata lugens]|uniref:uncharacterized protein LOC111050675 isoform X2 n=1 Tax=Nilaparvata lugens TaxID=108931 RepID=UPI00193DC1CB|nr:uncharacterized protein LOC111050675 isoform X2 [Nilaparvata lugens]
MFDTEKFIYLIEKLPPLYDVKSSDYSNRQLKAKCWSGIGKAMYETWHEMTPNQKYNKGKELMKKWKTLRDNFVRDFRLIKKNETGVPVNKKKKYVYFDQLSFLIPHIKGCESTVSNISPPDEQGSVPDEQPATTEPENGSTQPLPHVPGTSSGSKERERIQDRARKRKRPAVGTALASATNNIMQESIQLQKAGLERQDLDKFGNKAFMLSFVPTMDNFPQLLAFDVRMQITEVFRNALENASYTYLPYQQQQGPRPNSAASSPSTWESLGQQQSNDPGHDRETPLPGYNYGDEDDEDNLS